MIEISRADYVAKATRLFGNAPLDWKFKCWYCGKVQSGNSIIKQAKEGIKISTTRHPEERASTTP